MWWGNTLCKGFSHTYFIIIASHVIQDFANFAGFCEFCRILRILPDFANFTGYCEFCRILRILPDFARFCELCQILRIFAGFCEFCRILRILPVFAYFAGFCEFCQILRILPDSANFAGFCEFFPDYILHRCTVHVSHVIQYFCNIIHTQVFQMSPMIVSFPTPPPLPLSPTHIHSSSTFHCHHGRP